MNFDAPHYLPWIFGGIALFWILWLHRRWQSRTAQIWANPRFLKHWRRSHPLWQRYAADLCLCLAIIGIILALARPQWGLQATDMRQRSLDIAVLLDISNSMNLQDIAPSRWQRMVLELEVFLQKLTGDRVALVAFDGEAGLQSPLTDDVAALRELLWHSRPGILPDHGDGLSAAIHQTAKLLKTREDNYARIAVILSDGTSKSDYQRSREAAYALSNQGISLFIIGIGLHNPPPINNMPDTPTPQTPIQHTAPNAQQLPKPIPLPAWQSLASTQLQDIARAAQGQYWHINQVGLGLQSLYRSLQNLNRAERQQRQQQKPIPRFPIPIAFALFCLILQRILEP